MPIVFVNTLDKTVCFATETGDCKVHPNGSIVQDDAGVYGVVYYCSTGEAKCFDIPDRDDAVRYIVTKETARAFTDRSDFVFPVRVSCYGRGAIQVEEFAPATVLKEE